MDEIGRGGMGVVYRARQPSLGRDVALKVVSGQLCAGNSRLTRFRTEARAIARLNHPNIVPIYGQGEQDSMFYYAMALIDGCSLDAAIRHHPELLSSTALQGLPSTSAAASVSSSSRGQAAAVSSPATYPFQDESEEAPVPPRTIEDFRHLALLVADVADGLAHAHDHGVIHRDIKPQNLLLSLDGRMYISDFGLSRLLDEPRLTLTGELMGTPAYLSPEQIQGDEHQIDHRTDIYSLGVTLYELLTGRRPFRAKSREQIVSRICSDEPVRPRRIDRRIPRDLETICMRAVAKQPDKRFATAHVLADELRRFASGLPIRTKPLGMFERAVGGMRRHRGAAGIGLLVIICVGLSGGYASQVIADRRDRASQLLDSAYQQLVYFDYRSPDQVAALVEQAQHLGADPNQLNLVRALMSLGRSDNQDAITRLRALIHEVPQHVGAKYLLAWALWRSHQPAESRAAFDQADAGTGTFAADELFFRGLASHFDRPQLAIEAYRNANSLRAAQKLFFPQAVLHLARAYNQQMYATRSDENFASAEAILLQLIEQGHYGAYPYYLLSITQRLSGDIIEMSAGSGSPQAQQRFEAALDWARLGQTINAQDQWPITAEAECLERLGMLDEALEARTRAIAVSPAGAARCESFHYRWRLAFWTGDFTTAQADIAAHAQCMPESLHYAHVYPSWLAAESGDFPEALAEARALANESPDDAQAILWSAVCLRLMGRGADAQELLAQRQSEVRYDANLVPPQTPQWVQSVYEFALGQKSLEELLILADQGPEPHKLRAEAYFHAAIAALAAEQRQAARDLLTSAVFSYDSQVRYTYHARILLTGMQLDPNWPQWSGAPQTQ